MLIASRAQNVIACALLCFRQNTTANLYHASKILNKQIELFPEEVIQFVGYSCKKAEANLNIILNHLHSPPVLKLLCNLLCDNRIIQINPNETEFSQSKIENYIRLKSKFFITLSEYNIMGKIFHHITGEEFSIDHRTAAAELLAYVIDKWNGDEICMSFFIVEYF